MLVHKYDDPTYLQESWILYGIGVFIIFLRFAVRTRTVGLQGFQGDDYLTLVVLACFTSDAVAVRIIQHHGSNVDYSEAEMRAMTAEERDRVSYGSRLQFVCWYTYPTLMWALKGCMLFFFNRLTLGLTTQRVVKWMAYACGVTYAVIIMVTSLSCLPYKENWATLPYPRDICSTRFQDMYVVTILNVLTDAAMLSVPLPLLWRLQVPLRRKLALGVMLLGGVFVIVAAIVRICMSLQAEPSTVNINRWGIRETIAGILAINTPIIRPILSKAFWSGGPVSASGGSHSTPSALGKSKFGDAFRPGRRSKDAFEMLDPPHFHPDSKSGGTNTTIKAYGAEGLDGGDSERDVSDTASEDFIIQKNYAGKSPHSAAAEQQQRRPRAADMDIERGRIGVGRQSPEPLGGINVTTTYSVRPTSLNGDDYAVPDFMRSAGTSSPAPAELDGRMRDGR